MSGHYLTDTVGVRLFDRIGELVRPSDLAHPPPTMADADHRDDTFHTPIDRRGPRHRRATVARAINPRSIRINHTATSAAAILLIILAKQRTRKVAG
jgi:hypothetical protein